jgi:tetratricopeptide (TPR) repeat protein
MIWAAAVLLLLQAASPSPPPDPAVAVQALEAGRFGEAAAILEKLVAADPQDYRVRFNLAFAYSQLQRDPEAVEHYRKVVEQQPDLTAARLNLGMLLLRQKRPAEAVPHLAAAAAQRPEDFRSQFYWAEALLGSGQAEPAAAAYRKALGRDPQSAAAALGLGRALARSGTIDLAREQYLQAAQLDPDYSDALLEFGDLLEQRQEPGQALGLYLEYLKMKPEAVEVRERTGVLLLQQQRYTEAMEHLETAVKENPTPANQAALAQGYAMTKQTAKALPLLRAAAEAEPGDADLRFRLGTALLETGESEAASREFLAVVQKQPENAAAWNGLGFALYKLENFPGALQAMDRAAQLGTEPPGNHFLRAIILDKFQQYPAALESYQRFLETASGKYPDDEFKARQRVRIITNILKKRR